MNKAKMNPVKLDWNQWYQYELPVFTTHSSR